MSTLDRVLDALNKKRAQLKESEQGFSLVELLVVVLIIAVLAAIAVPLYLSSVETAEEAAADATCSNALSMYTSAAFEEGGYSAGMGEQVVQALNGQSDEYTVTVAGGDGTDNISFSVDYGGDAPATCEGVSI